jgi:hypothetical protein
MTFAGLFLFEKRIVTIEEQKRGRHQSSFFYFSNWYFIKFLVCKKQLLVLLMSKFILFQAVLVLSIAHIVE